jgi:hypothetical protein
VDAGYDLTRWLSAKLGYLWESIHRERREVLDSNEHSFGPTFDLKPASWLLVRMGYRRMIRDAHDYDIGRKVVVEPDETQEEIREEHLADLRKYEMAARNRDKYSLFAQVSPLQNVTLHAGFDFNNDRFPRTVIGLKKNINYVPSVGLTYSPADWVTLFADYNWDRYNWKMKAIERSSTTQAACGLAANTDVTPATCPGAIWNSRGIDSVNTFGVGSDVSLIKNLLTFRLHYTISDADAKIRASGNGIGSSPATNFPTVKSQWHELLARFEYRIHKNVALRFGYYFNRFNSKDFGLDVMKPWMGDVDTGTSGSADSIFLGDNIKKPYTAHLGFLGLRLSF